MDAGFCSLKDWQQASDLFKELGLSRSQLKKHYPSKFLSKKIRARDELSLPLNLINFGMISPTYAGETPYILEENDDFLVIHKPAKIHGHALSYLENDNILSWMRSIGYGSLLEIAREQHERGLLYRLDQATSGVLIYVKKATLWQDLRSRFHQVAHLKRYIVVVDKKPTQEGLLNGWFDLSGKRVKVYSEHKPQCNEGSMFVRLVKEDQRGVILAIDLAHGHRHQIRAHLAMLGCPIRGDEIYGGTTAQRLYLHAYQYRIENLITTKDENLGFGDDFLDLNSDLEMLSDHSGIIHGR
tara:strand:+ start:685 stop:1578 length:894 start_codon:yes stop_codon:yes gene_type:complete